MSAVFFRRAKKAAAPRSHQRSRARGLAPSHPTEGSRPTRREGRYGIHASTQCSPTKGAPGGRPTAQGVPPRSVGHLDLPKRTATKRSAVVFKGFKCVPPAHHPYSFLTLFLVMIRSKSRFALKRPETRANTGVN